MIKIWADTQIEPGTRWREEINHALACAKVAVLLVTPNFLASDFIMKHELPLLEVARKDGLSILWIAIRTSWYTETCIAEYQHVNNPTRPFESLSRPERNKELVRICEKIKKALDTQ